MDKSALRSQGLLMKSQFQEQTSVLATTKQCDKWKKEFIGVYGFRGVRAACDREAQKEAGVRAEQEAECSHPQPRAQRRENWKQGEAANPENPLTVMYFLQQGDSLNLPGQHHQLRPSVQIPGQRGTLLVQATTATFLGVICQRSLRPH